MTTIAAHRRHPQGLRVLVLSLAGLAALGLAPAAHAKAPKADPQIVLAQPRDYEAAIAAIEKATGAKAADLELKGNPLPADQARSFRVAGPVATRLIDGSHGAFLKAGLYLFRHERSFGMGGGLDVVGLVKGTDRNALIRKVGTADPSNRLDTEKIIAELDALNAVHPFDLNEIGDDYVAGHFEKSPKDPGAVARRCAEISPELVKGSGAAISLLTEEIRSNRTLYLIW